MKKHFKSYATFLKESYLSKPRSSLLEFGCNDGALLEEFLAEPHIRILGIDPSENVSQMAKAKKIPVITDYFTTKTARTIVQQYGKMDVVTGSNVFAHVDDVHEIIKAAKIVLSPEGVFIIEVHYLGSLMKEFQYDTIYHEHLTYYSVSALKILFGLQQMRIVDVQMLTMHGGGIRVIACREDAHHKQKRSVSTILQEEQLRGLSRPDTFTTFGDACKKHRAHLISFLQSINNKNSSIVGYGAPGRGTMLLNYCQITNAYLDYVVDISPLRYGKYVPGVHLPIYHPRKVKKNPPNYILILAWNYAESILEQEKELRAQGVQFIIPFPTIGLL